MRKIKILRNSKEGKREIQHLALCSGISQLENHKNRYFQENNGINKKLREIFSITFLEKIPKRVFDYSETVFVVSFIIYQKDFLVKSVLDEQACYDLITIKSCLLYGE